MATIRHLFHIDASPESVFNHISQGENIKKWWTPQTTGDDSVGGTLRFGFDDRGFIVVKVDELVAGEKILWTCTDGDPEWHGTKIQFYLSWNEEVNQTKVNFIHEGFAEATEFFGLCSFSWAKYFMSLKSVCEGGEGQPYK